MRIVAGLHRGVPLSAPAGRDVRPTSERMREAIFNILQHDTRGDDWALGDVSVLDLFAGSGALGLEALSRGASFALFVENAAGARAAIRRNIENLHLEGKTRLWRRDATKLGPMPQGAGGPFGLVFCDPPYVKGAELNRLALSAAITGGWLAPTLRVVMEQAEDDVMPEIEGLTLIDTRSYGAAKLGIFTRSS